MRDTKNKAARAIGTNRRTSQALYEKWTKAEEKGGPAVR